MYLSGLQRLKDEACWLFKSPVFVKPTVLWNQQVKALTFPLILEILQEKHKVDIFVSESCLFYIISSTECYLEHQIQATIISRQLHIFFIHKHKLKMFFFYEKNNFAQFFILWLKKYTSNDDK